MQIKKIVMSNTRNNFHETVSESFYEPKKKTSGIQIWGVVLHNKYAALTASSCSFSHIQPWNMRSRVN